MEHRQEAQQILGPFGPPKKRVYFVMSIFLSEADLLICSMCQVKILIQFNMNISF